MINPDHDSTRLPACPFCGADTVERHYALQDGGVTWPGCTTCETTALLEDWMEAVKRVGAT